MKKIIVIIVVCLVCLILTGCATYSSETDRVLELEGLGFTHPSNMTDVTEPFEVWSVGISGSNSSILVMKADSGWVYYPQFLKDMGDIQNLFGDYNLRITIHQSEQPCIRVRHRESELTSYLGFGPDWNNSSIDDYYFYKISTNPTQWSRSQTEQLVVNDYRDPGYIPNISLQAIKDGAVKFFADDPHGNKAPVDNNEEEYVKIYSMVWDFEKGGLK